jgi:hypothetical protein
MIASIVFLTPTPAASPIGRTDDERYHRVELEPHDRDHDRDDRYRRVGDDGDL